MHNSEQEFSAAIFIFSHRLPAVHGDDVIMPPDVVLFPRAGYNYCIILVHSYRHGIKNHTVCGKLHRHLKSIDQLI